MDIFETIIYFTEALLEGYEAYKEQQEEKGVLSKSPEERVQAYKDLATTNNSIRRKKTQELKKAAKEHKRANKEELALRKSGNLYAHLKALDKSEEALNKLKKAREEEKEAYAEVEKARDNAYEAQED